MLTMLRSNDQFWIGSSLSKRIGFVTVGRIRIDLVLDIVSNHESWALSAVGDVDDPTTQEPFIGTEDASRKENAYFGANGHPDDCISPANVEFSRSYDKVALLGNDDSMSLWGAALLRCWLHGSLLLIELVYGPCELDRVRDRVPKNRYWIQTTNFRNLATVTHDLRL
jgi:hypothetical protein